LKEDTMSSALFRKSITDLSRRRSRTFFAVTSLALAVASIGLFALPTLMDRSMQAEVTADRLPDLTVYTQPVVLHADQLAKLAALPNVRAVQARAFFGGRMYIGERRAYVQVRGVPDFARQRVDVVHVATGAAPAASQVLTDVQNAKHGLLDVQRGQTVRVIGADGVVRRLHVSGEARNLDGGQTASDDGVVVLYATAPTVALLNGGPGYGALLFRLADTSPGAVDSTIASVRRTLGTVHGFRGFTDLPEVRASCDWPGRASFDSFSKFFYVISLLALLSALVLVSNTMTTLVAEQTREIGIMKAVGGRRRQIAGVYLRTALLLGALGTVVGVAVGIAIAFGLTRFFGSTYYAVDVGFGVDWTVVLVSALAGLLAPPLAALPAIRRATRVPLREALEASGSAVGSQDAGDRLLRGIRFLPRTAQIGLRSVGRRRRRSISTALVMAFAVGTMLALLGMGTAVSNVNRAAWGDHGEDVKITDQGHRFLNTRAEQLIRATPGVATVEPMFTTDAAFSGKDAIVWAVRPSTMFKVKLAAGRWYTQAENAAHAHVAVVENDIARVTGAQVGDVIRVHLASGTSDFRVIGISKNQQESGTAVFAPLATMHALMPGVPADGNDFWVRTTSHEHPFVDRTTTRIEDTLTKHGYDVSSEIRYVRLADEIATYRTLTTTLTVLGLLIVGISMAGLANALTMSVLERTREIGILRSIGARARDIRRIFAAETLALAIAGWLAGIAVGYVIDMLLVWLVRHIVNVDLTLAFPAANVAIALVGGVVLALLVTVVPIRRAVRQRPGDALRYA
jgi:putative ABC transport system permease protein